MLTEEHMARSVGGWSNPQRTSQILVRVIAASLSEAPCSAHFPSDGARGRDDCA